MQDGEDGDTNPVTKVIEIHAKPAFSTARVSKKGK